jgi:hypothetical protein
MTNSRCELAIVPLVPDASARWAAVRPIRDRSVSFWSVRHGVVMPRLTWLLARQQWPLSASEPARRGYQVPQLLLSAC